MFFSQSQSSNQKMNSKNSSTNGLDFFIIDSPEEKEGGRSFTHTQKESPYQEEDDYQEQSDMLQGEITEEAHSQVGSKSLPELLNLKTEEIQENLIDCNVFLEPSDQKELPPIQEKISLSSQEYEQVKRFFKASSERRASEKVRKQERRTFNILEKIRLKEQPLFFQENCLDFSKEKQCWYYVNKAALDSGHRIQERRYQETSEVINFFLPKYSWLLESWLSKQTHSFAIKRFNPRNKPEGQPLYQISFGLSDQNFIEAEAPNKESCLVAAAEDLLLQSE